MASISLSFQSTHPVRGATIGSASDQAKEETFQSTHPVRGATGDAAAVAPGGFISIHAPREGCDRCRPGGFGADFISIHAPREGCDRNSQGQGAGGLISIHAPREGCDPLDGAEIQPVQISIHAPREGCDREEAERRLWALKFQSTHPVRGATLILLTYMYESGQFQSTHPVRGATMAAQVVS